MADNISILFPSPAFKLTIINVFCGVGANQRFEAVAFTPLFLEQLYLLPASYEFHCTSF